MSRFGYCQDCDGKAGAYGCYICKSENYLNPKPKKPAKKNQNTQRRPMIHERLIDALVKDPVFFPKHELYEALVNLVAAAEHRSKVSQILSDIKPLSEPEIALIDALATLDLALKSVED